MVHPFENILSGCESNESETSKPSRRRVLGLAVGGVVAAATGRVRGQIATTMAIGEEGGRGRPKLPVATTKAVGEEGGIGGKVILPGQLSNNIAALSRNFRVALRAGDVETAADNLQKIEVAAEAAKPKNRYKTLVANFRKQLSAGLTGKLKRADKDLGDKKLVPAIKAYRAVSRVQGFKQADDAKSKLVETEKLDGHADALAEVKAQELYDTAAKAKKCDKLTIYKQVARDHGKTATGKKAAKRAKDLEVHLARDEAAAAKLFARAKKAKGSTKTRMLRTIVARYPDTESGKSAALMLPKNPVRIKPPNAGGGPIATTLAFGEEG